MGDIGKPLRETERPAPVPTAPPDREPLPERAPPPQPAPAEPAGA
jgi:hypothetical protein